MKNGVYYTDGTFFVRVDEDDALDMRQDATKVVGYRNDKLEWEDDVKLHSHKELLASNERILSVRV